MFSGIRSASECHHVKFRQNRSNGCGDIAILRFSKMASAAILFSKIQIPNGYTFVIANLRYYAKFHQDRSIRCWHMAIFLFSRSRPTAILDFWNCDFKYSSAWEVAMRVNTLNFVKIGEMVAEILRFYGFPKWRPPPSWIFKNSNS